MKKNTFFLLAMPVLVTTLWLPMRGAQLVAARIAPEQKIVGGPYVVNAGPQRVVLMWLVQTGEASFGDEPGKTAKTVPILHAEKIVFTGLKPGKTYYYESFPGEGGKGSFKTPPSGPGQFQFVVFGDTRTRHDVHRSVIKAVLKYAQPDFVMHVGDLVAEGSDTSLWPIFLDIERELLRKTAFFPALGNHERNAPNYYEYLDAKPYYSFDWGSAHFAIIDSDIENVAATQAQKDAFWREQTNWLRLDLKGSQKAGLRFVFAHHPPMTAVERRQGDNPHMTALEPIFQEYRVSAAFFGHDHNYQHYLKDGVHFFITGGGGAPLYDVNVPPAGITQKVESIENFVIVNVDGSNAHLEARKADGGILDTADLRH